MSLYYILWLKHKRVTKCGNNFAISSTGIGEALQRSASALAAAGNSLDESIALVTAANSVIQNPESVGTALKTMSMRLRKTKVELEDIGEETDGAADSVSELQDKLMALTHGKVDIMKSATEYKNTTEILREMASAWGEMTDAEHAAALQLMGGQRQGNILASVIENFDVVEDALRTSLDSEGSAYKENEKYLNSIQGRIDLFKNAAQTMWTDALDSDAIKFFVDLGTAIIKVVDSVGLLKTVLGAALAAFAVKGKGFQFFTKTATNGIGLGDLFTKTGKSVPLVNTGDMLNEDQFKEQITSLVSAFDPLNSSWNEYVSNLQGADPAMQQVLAGFKDQTEAANEGVGAYGAYSAAAQSTGAQIQGIGVKSLAASIGVKALNAALSMGIGLLVGFIVQKVVSWIDNTIHRTEKLKEEVADLTKEYKTAKEEFSENLKTLTESSDSTLYKDLQDEFSQLANGVDEYGNNIGLTADEYNRYKDICEKIIGIQPSIAEGYDSATEAIGNNVSILSQLIELQKQEARQTSQEFINDENMGKQAENAIDAYQEAQDKVEKYIMSNGAQGIQGISGLLYEAFDWNNVGTKDFGDASDIGDDLAAKILEIIGYTDTDISKKLSGYYNDDGYFEYYDWINDYAGEIAANKEKIATAISQSAQASEFEDLSETFRSWADGFKIAENDVKEAQNSLISTFLQVPLSMPEYDQLSNTTQSFITEWIKNGDMFKIDEGTTQEQILATRDKIKQFIRGITDGDYTTELSDGTIVTAQDILDQIVAIDPSKVDYATYRTQVQNLIDMLWSALGTSGQAYFNNDKQQLAISLGLDFTTKDTDIKKQADVIAKRIHMDSTDLQDRLQQMTPAEVDAFLKINWDTTDISSWDEVEAKIQEQAQNFNSFSVDTFSAISDDISKFNEIVSQTDEIVANNTEVSKEYKESLTALGFSQEELNDVFDESNPLLVKNAALLRKLVAQKKEEKRETVQMAKANNLLQYRNTVKQLQQVVAAMGQEYIATGRVSDATRKSVDVLRSQLTVLKQTQREYALLEIQLSGVTNAYENFEKAKNLDAKLTYGDSMIEMLNTINDGLKTGQVGTEAFQAAVEAFVPPSVYTDLNNFNDRMVAIHDYVDKNPLFADWFTIKDGEFSITQENIKNFVDDAQKAGAFTMSDENGNFDLGKGVETIDDFVDKINEAQDGVGVTKESVIAMLTEFSKYNASWSDILSDLTTNQFDKEINEQTEALEKATLAKAEYLKAGGEYDETGEWLAFNKERWDQLCDAEKQATIALNQATAAADDNAKQYMELNTIYDMATGKIKGNNEQVNLLFKNLGLISENSNIQFEFDENGNLKLTTEQAELLNQKLGSLEEPTIISAQFAFDTLSKQLEAAKKYLNGADKTVLFDAGINVGKITPEQLQGKIDALPFDKKKVLLDAGINLDGLSIEEIQQKIDEMSDDQKEVLLNVGIKVDELSADELKTECNNLISTIEPTLQSISLTYGITQTSAEQQDGTIEKLKNWEVNGIHFTAYVEVDGDSKAQVEEINTEKDQFSEPETTTYTVNGTGEQAVYGIKNAWAAIPTTRTTTYTVKQQGNIPGSGTVLNGTAHASGSWGAAKSETDLVGELGPELRVRGNRWDMLGEHGAEFTDVKKGDIIFNHKQTEQLLKNKYISSRGKMVGGQTFAEGNARYGLFTGYTGYDQVFANGSNEWVDAWANAIDSISDAAGSISDAGDNISDAADDFKEMFDWFAVLLEEIDDDLNYLSASLDNAVGISAKSDIQDQMININKLKLNELVEGYTLYADYAADLLNKVPEQYRALAQQGGVALTQFLGEADQKTVDAINEYREWAQKVEDVSTQQQQVRAEITSLSLEKVQMIADEYGRATAKVSTLNDLIQANIDLLEEQGERTSAVMYEAMIKNSKDELEQLRKQRDDMQKEFDAQVSAGNIEVGSEAWYEVIAAIQDVDKAIIDCQNDIEKFQNSINQLHWDNFDNLVDAIDNVGKEISNLGDLIDDEDITDEMGNWTNEGITKMGLLAQEMERAQYRAEQYAEQIEYLNQEYAAGKYSTDEYNEKLQELKDGQWDSIKSYEAAKDAIVDLNKTRVQAVKDGIQKELDAYQKLIDKKKEELNLQQESHDFQKQVAEEQKHIATIQKQLAAMAGDNSASAVARRKQLEAELASAQEELEELYYNHSIEKQQDALDEQMDNYQEEKDKEMDKLDEYLKNVEQVIADSFQTVANNTQAVSGTLQEIAKQYGINITEAVTSPWEQGANAIGTYQDKLNTSISAFTEQLGLIKQQLIDLQTEADETAQHLVNATNQQANSTGSATYTPPTPSNNTTQETEPQKPAAPSTGSSVTVKKSATHFSRDGGNGTRMQSWVPGSTFTVYQVSGSEVLIGRNGQYTGWVKLSDIEGYKHGTKGVKKDQLAITDENGLEELVLHAGANGRLQFLSKGSAVIPADISDNLMKLGSLDPSDVLDRNRPKTGAPYIVNNNLEINMEFGSLVHVDTVDQDTLPKLQKMVRSEFDNCMKQINQGLKRYTR